MSSFFRTKAYACALLLVFSISPGVGAAPDQQGDEARDLQAREQQLTEKVRTLQSEQKQLLLRKMLYSADSKYLEIDLGSGEGTLRYRTRILKTFRFTSSRKLADPPEGGIFTLTAKADGSTSKRLLSFNNGALAIQGKNYRGGRGGKGLALSLGRKDFAAIYYALEAGSFLYMKEMKAK